MNASDYVTSVLNDAKQNYPDLIDQNQEYVGGGTVGTHMHIYLVLICTLPLFKKLEDALTSLEEMFIYSRALENYNLEERLLTPKRTIRFFSNFSQKYYLCPQTFVIKPAPLKKLIAMTQKKGVNLPSADIVHQLFCKNAEVRHILHNKTVKRIQNAKTEIINRNWNKATQKLRSLRILGFIYLIWKNLMIRLDTWQFIKALSDVSQRIHVLIGKEHMGTDMYRWDRQMKLSGKI